MAGLVAELADPSVCPSGSRSRSASMKPHSHIMCWCAVPLPCRDISFTRIEGELCTRGALSGATHDLRFRACFPLRKHTKDCQGPAALLSHAC